MANLRDVGVTVLLLLIFGLELGDAFCKYLNYDMSIDNMTKIYVFVKVNVTKLRGWLPLLLLRPSSSSELTMSEFIRDGLGEFDGVDFLVVKSKGCSPLPSPPPTELSSGSASSIDSAEVFLIKFHPARPSPIRETDGKLLYKAAADMTLGESLPLPCCLELYEEFCGGRPSRRSRAREFWNHTCA